MSKDRFITTSSENGVDKKIKASVQLETIEITNIPGFYSLEIARLEYILPDDLTTYIYWQTTSSLYHYKY